MPAQLSVKLQTLILTGDNADDGTRHDDDGGCPPLVFKTEAEDNNLTNVFAKVGKGGQANGDALRCEYAKNGVASGDTFTLRVTALHQIDDGIEIQPYIDENSVNTTVGIIIASPIIGDNVFTITAAFATELNDSTLTDTNNFAIRLQPVAQEAGDFSCSEFDAVISAAAGGNTAQLPAQTLTLTPNAPSAVTTEKNIAAIAAAAVLTLTPFAPIAETFDPNTADLPSQTLTLTPFAPSAVATENHFADLPSATLTLTPNAPSAVTTEKNEAILPSATLTLTPFAPTVETFDPNQADLPSATLTLTPNAPTAVSTDNNFADLPAQTLTLTPNASSAVVTEKNEAILDSVTLTLTPNAPSVVITEKHEAILPSATLSLTPFAPQAVVTETTNLKIKSTLVAINAATGNQDITIAGFGTVKAAMFVWTAAASADDHAPEIAYSIGFFDGTRSRCSGYVVDNAVTTTDTDRNQSDISCGLLQTPGTGVFDGVFSGVSFITDGVRINVDNAPASAYLCAVTLFGGSDIANIYCDHKDDLGTGTAAVPITEPGFQADFVLIHTVGSPTVITGDDIRVHALLNFGVWSADDATQMHAANSSENAAALSDTNAYVNTTKGIGQTDWTGIQWLGTLGVNVNGFEITPDQSASNDIVIYLAIKWAVTPSIEIVNSTLPASAVDWVESGFTFQPEFGLSCFVGATAVNANDLTPTPSMLAVSLFETGQVLTVGSSETHNVGTTEVSCYAKSTFFHGDPDAVTVLSEGTLQSLDANGWTVDLGGGSHDSVARQGWSLAIKAAPADANNIAALPSQTLTLTPFAPLAVTQNEAILPAQTLTLTPFAPNAVSTDNNFADLPSVILTLTPNAPNAVTTEKNEAILDSATLTLTPNAPSVVVTEKNEAILPSATLTLTPNAPDSVVTEKNIADLPSQTLTLTPNAPSAVVTENNEAILPSQTLTLTPNAPDAVTTEKHEAILPSVTLTLTPNSPDSAVTEKNEAILPSVTLTLTPFAPDAVTTEGDNNIAQLPAQTLTLTPFAPNAATTEKHIADLPSATLTLTPFAPTAVATENHFAVLPSAVLTLSPFAPQAITSDIHFAALPAQTLTLTPFAPSVVSTDNNTATLISVTLTLTPFAPTVFVPGNELSSTNDPDVIDLTDPRFFILIK